MASAARLNLLVLMTKAGPKKSSSLLTSQFFMCLEADGYPQEDIERVFGGFWRCMK